MFSAIKDRINSVLNNLVLKKNGVVYSQSLKISGRINIFNGGEIIIHDNVRIRSGFEYVVLGGYDKAKLYTGSDGKIELCEKAGISGSVICAMNSIYVGPYVNIGAGCLITDSNHHSISFSNRCLSAKDTDIHSKPIRIEEGVFIGANSVILGGVTIGKHSIVGAGSVVRKSIPENEIWAGNPASFVKMVED